MKSERINNIIAVIALLVIALSLASIYFGLSKLAGEKVTGYASGYVNLTVNTQVTINVTRDTINWGPGNIASGKTNATLTTIGDAATAVDGNWSTAEAKSILVQNIGNVNCSLKLTAGKNAHSFFGSATSTNEAYQWNISNRNADTCGSWGETSSHDAFANVNTSQATMCNKWDYHVGSNTLQIDVKLVVPYDAVNTGARNDTITITGDAAV